MTAELQGKTVIVTGAGQGLGRAYALAAAAAGAQVVVNDVVEASAKAVVEQVVAGGGTAIAVPQSVTDVAGVEELVETTVSSFGSVDGLVNNAGVLAQAPSWELGEAEVRGMVEVNLLGSIYCGHAVIRQMLQQGTGGSVINVSSGTHLGFEGLAVYGATKGAIASLTYGWTLDLRHTPIRVNALSPLAITPMKLPPYDDHAMPEDIAAVVVYLLSDASAALRGQVVRRARRQLGLIKHPSIGTMLDGDWSVETIADAFSGPLSGELEGVGYGAGQLAPAGFDKSPVQR